MRFIITVDLLCQWKRARGGRQTAPASDKGFAMTTQQKLRSMRQTGLRSVNVVMRDVGNGLLEISHNSLAMLAWRWW
jgi:hypothetical protein